MRSALILAFLLGVVALLVALTPEILARLPRRRARDRDAPHLVRNDPDAPPPPARPDLKRENRDSGT